MNIRVNKLLSTYRIFISHYRIFINTSGDNPEVGYKAIKDMWYLPSKLAVWLRYIKLSWILTGIKFETFHEDLNKDMLYVLIIKFCRGIGVEYNRFTLCFYIQMDNKSITKDILGISPKKYLSKHEYNLRSIRSDMDPFLSVLQQMYVNDEISYHQFNFHVTSAIKYDENLLNNRLKYNGKLIEPYPISKGNSKYVDKLVSH